MSDFSMPPRINASISVSRNSIITHRSPFRRRSRCKLMRSAAADRGETLTACEVSAPMIGLTPGGGNPNFVRRWQYPRAARTLIFGQAIPVPPPASLGSARAIGLRAPGPLFCSAHAQGSFHRHLIA